MGSWYEIKGRLVFQTRAESELARELLTTNTESLFWNASRELEVKKEHLVFAAASFSGDAEALYSTSAQVKDLAQYAWRGFVKVIDGEGEDARVIGVHGAQRKRWPKAMLKRAEKLAPKRGAAKVAKKSPAAKVAKKSPAAKVAKKRPAVV